MVINRMDRIGERLRVAPRSSDWTLDVCSVLTLSDIPCTGSLPALIGETGARKLIGQWYAEDVEFLLEEVERLQMRFGATGQ